MNGLTVEVDNPPAEMASDSEEEAGNRYSPEMTSKKAIPLSLETKEKP